MSCDTVEDVTFELRKAGLQGDILLVFGIDYTASNDFQGYFSFNDRSLHDLNGEPPNPYATTIQVVGECLHPFTTRVLGYGFGDVTHQDQAVFPVHSGDGCINFQDFLDCYTQVTAKIRLGSKTSWTSLIDKTIEEIEKAAANSGRAQFTVLVIIGDSPCCDQQRAVESIVMASGVPMGIFFVGVGDSFAPSVGDSECHEIDRLDEDIGKLGRPFNNFFFTSYNATETTCSPATFGATLGYNLLHNLPESMAVALSLESIKNTIQMDEPSGWRCEICTFRSPADALCCLMCGTDQPAADQDDNFRIQPEPPAAPNAERDDDQFEVVYEGGAGTQELERDLQTQAQMQAEIERLRDQLQQGAREWQQAVREEEAEDAAQAVGPESPGWGTVDADEMQQALRLSEDQFSEEQDCRTQQEEQKMLDVIRLSEQQFASDAALRAAETPEESTQRLEAIRLSELEFQNVEMQRQIDVQMIEAAKVLSNQQGAHGAVGVVRSTPVLPPLRLGQTNAAQPASPSALSPKLTHRERIDIMAMSIKSGASGGFEDAVIQMTPRRVAQSEEGSPLQASGQLKAHALSPAKPKPSLGASAELNALKATMKRMPKKKKNRVILESILDNEEEEPRSAAPPEQKSDVVASPAEVVMKADGAAAAQPADFGRWVAGPEPEVAGTGGKGGKGVKGPPLRGKGKGKKGPAVGVKRDKNIMAMYNDVFKKGNKAKSAAAATGARPRADSSKDNRGGGDLLSELKGQSAFFKKVQKQAEELGPGLAELCPIISQYSARDCTDVLEFVAELEKSVSVLEDEVQVLKLAVPEWPHQKVGLLRELATRYKNLLRMQGTIKQQAATEVSGSDVFAATEKLVSVFDSVSKELDVYGRKREADQKRFEASGVGFEWSLVREIKEETVALANRYCQIALEQWKDSGHGAAGAGTDRKSQMIRKRASNLMQGALGFGFRVYGYAGGFDEATTEIYGEVHQKYQESQEQGASGEEAN